MNNNTLQCALRDPITDSKVESRKFYIYHIVKDGHAACDDKLLLDRDSTMSPEDILTSARCKRSGCANLWPAAPAYQ